jgi:hypothetical protein
MASVGLGMSAAAAPRQFGFAICRLVSGPSAHAPATNRDRQNPSPRPECPFCLVAAQSACHVATTGKAPAFPGYAGMQTAGTLLGHIGDRPFVPQFRRTVGDPRAPPIFSV